MNVQSWSNRWLNRLYKIIAILLVLIAVIMSALRLLLPYADNYRQNLQEYVNEVYRSDIKIGHLTTGWQKFGPTLVAKNVSLVESEAVKVFIEEIDVKVDFWSSVKERKLKTTDFTLIGAKVKLDKTLLTASKNKNETRANFSGLSELFLQQVERFTVKDSQMFVQDFHDQHRRFLIKQLAWLNEGSRHRAAGDVEVDGITKNTLKLQMDVRGTELGNFDGLLYLSGESINITPWLGRFTKLDMRHVTTDINFQSWLAIDDGDPVGINVLLGENSIRWKVDDKEHQLNLSDGQLQWRHNPITMQSYVQSSELFVNYDGSLWPALQLQGYMDRDTQTAFISQLDLDHIAKLYPLVETDSEKLNWFKQLAVTGIARDIHLKSFTNSWRALGSFEQLAWSYLDGIPGLSGVAGKFQINESAAQIDITSEQGDIDFEQHFEQPIPYNFLSAETLISWQENQWHIRAKNVSLISDELKLDGNLSFEKVDNAPIKMSLLAKVSEGDARNAGHYYPLKIMDKSLVDYLNDAIIDGTISNATVAINGPLNSFPYGDGSGMFIVDADLANATFQFSPDWPSITEFNANLNFTNKTMTITGESGYLRDLDVTGVVAKIANLTKTPELDVIAKVKQHPRAISDLMQASPLKSSVGVTLENLIVSGEVSADFSLNVPLTNVEQTLAKGTVYFNDNEVDLTSPSMAFSQVNGALSFENEKISTSDVTIMWQGMPAKIDVTGDKKNNQFVTEIDIDASWPVQQWPEYIPESIRKYAKGKLDFIGKFVMNHDENGEFDYNLSLSSSMGKMALALPDPFYKLADTQLSLSVSVNGDAENSVVSAYVGENLNFYGELVHEDTHFQRAHLVLGQEQMFLPVSGFHISVQLPQVDFQPWFDLVQDITNFTGEMADGEQSQTPILAKPERIRGLIGQLTAYQQKLDRISFDLQNLDRWWQLSLNAEQARADAKFFHDWQNLGVEVNADFIKLGDTSAEPDEVVKTDEIEKTLAPIVSNELASTYMANMVPIKVRCKSCQYNQMQFGELLVDLEKENEQTLAVRQFKAKRKGMDLTLDGAWSIGQSTNQTKLVGNLRVKDVENELNLLGYDSIIRDSGARVEFDIGWLGAPSDFDLARLNGQISSRLDNGYLADVDSNEVRLLSVLSLRSLVRKLTLDFRDVFGKGMFYKDIKGDLTLQNGVLYTDNIEMDGTAGDLSMQGNTNLLTGKLNYRMSFEPKIPSSIPLIVAWLTNPALGLAALAVDGVIKSAEVFSNFKYELTGTVNEPVFEQVDSESRVITVAPTKVAEKAEELDPTIPQLKQNNPTGSSKNHQNKDGIQ